MPRTGEPGRSVSSRLLQVLFTFRPGRDSMSLAELARETGLPYATVRRLTNELAEVGALTRHEDGRYRVGLRLWQLGTLAPHTESLRGVAQPFMEDLYSALRQHVQLAVRDGRHAVVIDRLSAPHALNLVSGTGGRLPLHCSGVGKVLLAHTEPELIDQVLAGTLRRFTSATVTDPAALRAELAECRRSGVATVRGELTPDAGSVATRIVDGEGRVVGALSVVVRSGSVEHQAVRPSLIACGLGISRQLGWQPAPPRSRDAGQVFVDR